MKLDMSQYLDVFLEESKEHLGSLNERLLELEKNPHDAAGLNEIFRAAHTLKGMSSTMGFNDLADLTHHMENLLSDLKEGLMLANTNVVNVLFQCVDRLQFIVDKVENSDKSETDNSDLIQLLENIKSGHLEVAAALEEQIKDESVPTNVSQALADEETFVFNDYDITVFKEALSQDYHVQYLKIAVEPACMMKAVRAFMVFKVLEELGDIAKSEPPSQELDEGKFEGVIELVYSDQS